MGRKMRGPCVGLLALLVIIGMSRANEITTTTTTTATSSTTSTVTAPNVTATNAEQVVPGVGAGINEKIARRIIEDRLTPPRATDFSAWNKRLSPLGEIHRVHVPPPRVTEDVDDNVTERAVPKKTRTVGPTQETNCCGGKSPGPNGFVAPTDKDKSQNSETLDLERGGNNGVSGGAGPAPRFHGNRPSDDRYGHGWRTSSYLGSGKEKAYYDQQRNHYAYDRYNTAQRPTSSYAVDGDRYGAIQRPGSNYGSESDRYSSASSSNTRPGYQSSNYAYGGLGGSGNGYNDRPRPGAGNYGISGSVTGEGDSDYPFAEGPVPPGAAQTNLQTQKAVALKALAGVALIGAAAALASNPVLLPISVISGRRKRSAEVESDNYALTALLQGYIQPKPNEVAHAQLQERSSNDSSATRTTTTTTTTTTTATKMTGATSQELVISPQCVARLACHVHRDYLEELEKSRAELTAAAAAGSAGNETEDESAALHGLEHWFDSLIHSNILVADYLSDDLKALIQSAVAVGSDKNASCDKFSCLNVHDNSSIKRLPN